MSNRTTNMNYEMCFIYFENKIFCHLYKKPSPISFGANCILYLTKPLAERNSNNFNISVKPKLYINIKLSMVHLQPLHW